MPITELIWEFTLIVLYLQPQGAMVEMIAVSVMTNQNVGMEKETAMAMRIVNLACFVDKTIAWDLAPALRDQTTAAQKSVSFISQNVKLMKSSLGCNAFQNFWACR